MIAGHIITTHTAGQIATLALTPARTVRHWLFQLGGVGLIPLGIIDSSVIPVPGSMDIVTIILSARQQDLWFYYALMATAGSVLGGFLTYRLARKGGMEALERRFSKRQVEKVYKAFDRWGFGAISIAAFLPPPVPMVPFLFAAGAMQYPVKKFLAALFLGRIARYTTLAFLAAHYGRQIILLLRHGHPLLIATIGLLITIAGITFVLLRSARSNKPAEG